MTDQPAAGRALDAEVWALLGYELSEWTNGTVYRDGDIWRNVPLVSTTDSGMGVLIDEIIKRGGSVIVTANEYFTAAIVDTERATNEPRVRANSVQRREAVTRAHAVALAAREALKRG